MATDEQIAILRNLSVCQVLLPNRREALIAVLAELAELRANMASLVDSSGEPPRLVRE